MSNSVKSSIELDHKLSETPLTVKKNPCALDGNMLLKSNMLTMMSFVNLFMMSNCFLLIMIVFVIDCGCMRSSNTSISWLEIWMDAKQ